MEAKQNKPKKSQTSLTILLISLFGILAIVGCKTVQLSNKLVQRPEIISNPKASTWYRISPKATISADGSPWHGLLKLGKENKVLVYFYGGGVSVDENSASKPELFYNNSVKSDGLEVLGISSEGADNPFRDWTIIVVPYGNGDFHLGTGNFKYAYEGKSGTLPHHGYTNFTKLMQQAMKHIKKPDAVMIAGFSAGGFGVSQLANDILTDYFPKVDNATVLVDGALLLSNKWKNIAENVWQTPKKISDRLVTNNLVLDGLKALSNDHPNAKILYTCSPRDGALVLVQNYLDNGIRESSEELGVAFQKNLKQFVGELQKMPNTGVFIWNGFPYKADNDKGLKTNTTLTAHTILFIGFTWLEFFDEEISVATWAMDAVNGNVKSYGVQLLQ